jgi:hypothetical protein
MAEIEIDVLRCQCRDRRIDNKQVIVAEVAARQQRRNAEGARIQWMFTTERGEYVHTDADQREASVPPRIYSTFATATGNRSLRTGGDEAGGLPCADSHSKAAVPVLFSGRP